MNKANFCWKCGASIATSYNSCSSCGAKLKTHSSQQHASKVESSSPNKTSTPEETSTAPEKSSALNYFRQMWPFKKDKLASAYLTDEMFDFMAVVALRDILTREIQKNQVFDNTTEELIKTLVRVRFWSPWSSSYSSEDPIVVTEQVLIVGRRLADKFLKAAQSPEPITLSVVTNSCDYYLKVYSKIYDRGARKKSFLKRH